MTYRPQPLDTSKVTLPREIDALAERLAENTHDVWAAQRIADGWTFGPARNDTLKQHPGLVPYGDLEESEKVYDRRVAEETLNAVLLLGYRIEPRS
ncbi:MAG TPA: RyR domain-containing protein [Pirellulales bacterium]|jgi:ryanodine receptor 2|nr:RyR domain-containing protein [Pirellulales bacterium]